MEKRLDPEQYIKDLEKHIDKLSDNYYQDLVKARALLEKSLWMIDVVPNALLWEDVPKLKDDIEDYLHGATRNYVDQD